MIWFVSKVLSHDGFCLVFSKHILHTKAKEKEECRWGDIILNTNSLYSGHMEPSSFKKNKYNLLHMWDPGQQSITLVV